MLSGIVLGNFIQSTYSTYFHTSTIPSIGNYAHQTQNFDNPFIHFQNISLCEHLSDDWSRDREVHCCLQTSPLQTSPNWQLQVSLIVTVPHGTDSCFIDPWKFQISDLHSARSSPGTSCQRLQVNITRRARLSAYVLHHFTLLSSCSPCGWLAYNFVSEQREMKMNVFLVAGSKCFCHICFQVSGDGDCWDLHWLLSVWAVLRLQDVGVSS